MYSLCRINIICKCQVKTDTWWMSEFGLQFVKK